MRKLLIVTAASIISITAFGSNPDFDKIFAEISVTNSVTEAIDIRVRHLKEMRNLSDFNKLTNLEKVTTGTEFFNHYKRELSFFISENASRFMKNPNSKYELSIVVNDLLPKMFDPSARDSLLKDGLVYITNCDEYKDYVAKTAPSFKHKYMKLYCPVVRSSAYQSNTEIIHLLTNPRYVSAGTIETVNLTEERFIKKVYISAVGMGSDASFDIVVNGDTKGTVYVPKYDPSYIVTVHEYADQLVIRSLSGDSKIYSISIEVEK